MTCSMHVLLATQVSARVGSSALRLLSGHARQRPVLMLVSAPALRRCVVQLSVLGYILVPIFVSHRWYVVVAYAFVMALVGAYEASSRPAYKFRVRRTEPAVCYQGSAAADKAGCRRVP